MSGDTRVYLPQPESEPEFMRHKVPVQNMSQPPSGEPRRCFHIQVEYIPPLLGLIDYYLWPDAHIGTDAEKALQVAFWQQLQLILMFGNMECWEGEMAQRYRQSPSDPCVLQVSYDEGETWSTLFDYGLCFRNALAQDTSNAALAQAQVNVFVYDTLGDYGGNLGDIAPDMVHDSTGMDAYRNKAACLMIHNIVEVTKAAALAYNEKRDGWLWDINRWFVKARLKLIDTYLWLAEYGFDIPIIPEVQLVEALRNIEAQTLELLSQDDLDALQDQDLLEQIVCYAFDRVVDDSVGESDFRTMFDGVESLEGVSEDVETWLSTAVDSERMYVANMKLVNELVGKLVSGEIQYQCPCEEWSADIFAYLQILADPLGTGADIECSYVTDHWQHDDAKLDPNSAYYYRVLSLMAEFPECFITKVQITDYTLLAFAYSDMTIYCDDTPTDNPYLWTKEWTGYNGSFVTPEFGHYTSRINLLGKCDRDTNINDLNGSVLAFGLTVFGKGYNPFV